MEDEIFSLLKNFADFVKREIEKGMKKGEIIKDNFKQEVFRWRLNDFKYTLDKGIVSSGASGETTTKDQPYFLHDIDKKIEATTEYKDLIKELSKKINNQNIENSVRMFLRKFISIYLKELVIPVNLIDIFSKELKGEPIRMKAFVELTGLNLEPDYVQINSGLKLRKPTREDLEKENVTSPFFNRDLLSLQYPSAIMEVEIFGRSAIELQNYIEKIITFLRLFGTGGVKYTRYTLSSEGVSIFIGGTVHPGDRKKSNEFYVIYNKDIDRLKKFWGEMTQILVSGANQDQFSNSQPNLFFSYQRYSEAILSNDIIEKKIVNAISGLESLYINTDRELSKYLRLSVSKIMSIFGYNPYEVIEQIKDSYNIRSTFIHGDLLNYNKKRKFIRRHGSLENLFNNIANYLRVSIVFLLALRKEKDEFIDLLEDAFIDKEKEDTLKAQINSIKERFSLE